MSTPDSEPDDILVRPGEGETISRREEREVAIVAALEQLTVTRSRYSPGERGPDSHVHRQHTDAFYVLEGELTFGLGPGDDPVRMPAGGFVAVPPNVAHSFRNDGSVDARFLNLHSPDRGFAAFMRAARDGVNASFDSFDPPPDGGRPADEAILNGPGEGERLVSPNKVVTLKGALPDLCFSEFELDGPFDGPRLHQHDDQVDAFYVLEGELAVTVEDALHAAGRGTLAAIPSGVRHTFAHTSDGRARFLNVHAPDGGFAEFLRSSRK